MDKANRKKLFGHLFNQMKKLENKEISVEEAKAQANLSKQVNNVLRYNLDEAIAKAKYKEDLKITTIE